MNRPSSAPSSGPLAPNNTGSRLGLVAANLLPLFGVVFLGWDLLSILLLYWLETLLISALAIVRAVRRFGGRALGQSLLFLLAFITLGAGHMAVILVIAEALGQLAGPAPDLSEAADAPLFSALETIYIGGLEWIARTRPELLLVALPAQIFSQVYSWWKGPTLLADGQLDSGQTILLQALARVVILHLALLLGSAIIAALRASDMLPVLALLILFKLLFDLRAHRQAEQLARPGESDTVK